MQKIVEIRNKWFLEQVEILSQKGITRTQIAERLNVVPQYLTPILKGKRNASEKFVLRFCEEFQISHNDLLNKLRTYDTQQNESNTVFEPKQDYNKKIPFFDDVHSKGGTINGVADVSYSTTPTEWIDAGDWFPGATSAIRHYGDSMAEYPSGSILALKRVNDIRLIVWGRNYLIETTEYRITKQLQQGEKGYLVGYSTNREIYPDGRQVHSPIQIPVDTIRSIDLVLGCVIKEYSNGATPIIK